MHVLWAGLVKSIVVKPGPERNTESNLQTMSHLLPHGQRLCVCANRWRMVRMVDFNVWLPHSCSFEKGLFGVQGPSGGWATEQDMCSHRTEHWLDWRLVQLGPLAGSLSSSFHLTNKKQKNSLHEGLCIDLGTAFCVAITCCLSMLPAEWR